MLERDLLNSVVTSNEASTIVGVSTRTITRWCEQGKIPARGTDAGWLIARSTCDIIHKIGVNEYLKSDNNSNQKENTESWQKPLF